MTDYILREAAIEVMYKDAETHPDHTFWTTQNEALRNIPAADVRPVVLCRDCKWCHDGYCEKYDDIIPFGCANKPWEDWFCADGAMLKK